jgi:hypothetical protein
MCLWGQPSARCDWVASPPQTAYPLHTIANLSTLQMSVFNHKPVCLKATSSAAISHKKQWIVNSRDYYTADIQFPFFYLCFLNRYKKYISVAGITYVQHEMKSENNLDTVIWTDKARIKRSTLRSSLILIATLSEKKFWISSHGILRYQLFRFGLNTIKWVSSVLHDKKEHCVAFNPLSLTLRQKARGF